MEKNRILELGEYIIPDGCVVKLAKGRIVVSERVVRGLAPGDYRCRDCVHRILGHCNNSGHSTMVCEKRPKPGGLFGFALFYHAPMYQTPCANFELDPSVKESKWYNKP